MLNYQRILIFNGSKTHPESMNIRSLDTYCKLFLVLFFLNPGVFAQEKLVKIIPGADIQILDEKKGAKTYLAEEYPGFTEARLYLMADSTYALEIFYVKDQNLFKERKYLSQEETEAFRDKLYNQYFHGYTEKEFDQSGRTLLLTGSSVVGLGYYGYALPLSLSVEDEKTFLALYMLSSGAGFFIPLATTKNIEVTRAQASMTLWGQSRGIYHGIALSHGLINTPEPEPVLGIGIATSVLEGFINFQLAGKWNFTSGDASVYQMGGDMGAIGGLLLADAFNLYARDNARGVLLTSLAGSVAGLAGGKYLADSRQYTVGDAIYMRSSVVLGSHVSVSLVNLFQPGESKPYTIGALLGGAAGGILAGRNLKGKDYTTGQGILIAVGQLAGGLLGFGVGYLVASDPSDSEILLISSAIGAGGGFALLSSQLAPKKQNEATDVSLHLNLNPLGFHQPKALGNLPPIPGLTMKMVF